MQTLFFNPGQVATIFLEVTDGYSDVRIDSYFTPFIDKLILPNLSEADGYSTGTRVLTRLDIGLYAYRFALPFGASSIGSYFVDVKYGKPDNAGGNSGNDISSKGYQIIVNAPFGNFAASIQSTI